MDDTAYELPRVIRDSTDARRIQDAGVALIGVLPSLDRSAIADTVYEMTRVLRDSSSDLRRRVAQQVLIVFKNV